VKKEEKEKEEVKPRSSQIQHWFEVFMAVNEVAKEFTTWSSRREG